MNIEEKFNKLIKDLEHHCESVSCSSDIKDYLNCNSYKEIINLGKESLRYIYREMENRKELDLIWVPLVREIIGEDFSIPESIKGKINEMNSYTKRWLDWNLYKYIDINNLKSS